MPADAGEKTEAPTPRRLQEARQRGQVARSADLSAALGLLAALILLSFYGSTIMAGFGDLLKQSIARAGTALAGDVHPDENVRLVLRHIAVMVGPFLLMLVVVAVVVNLLQVGFIFTGHPLLPSLEKLSPLAGFRRLFSKRTAMRLLLSLAKVAVIGTVAGLTIRGFLPRLVNVGDLHFLPVIELGSHLVLVMGLRLAAVLLVLALLDFAYQKYQALQDLRMTKEEVKEELKRMEGDPLVQQRRRAVARQLAAQRMSQAVPQADVVITNPTELAVALKYDHASMPAPKVVARGAGYIARRIREIADEHGVPIVERKTLAQALYKSCEVGDYVPPQLYRAVAEVLAYVFELAGKGYRRPVAG